MAKLKQCQQALKDRDVSGQPVPTQIPHPTPTQQQPQSQLQQTVSLQQMTSHPTGPSQTQSHMTAAGSHLPQYNQQHMSQIPSQGTGPMGQNQGGPYQGYPTTMHGQGSMAGPQASMQSHTMGMGSRTQPPPSYQGPLAYLEQTTSNIGLPERR